MDLQQLQLLVQSLNQPRAHSELVDRCEAAVRHGLYPVSKVVGDLRLRQDGHSRVLPSPRSLQPPLELTLLLRELTRYLELHLKVLCRMSMSLRKPLNILAFR